MQGRLPYFIVAAIAAVLFLPFLGHVHLFDWDEVNFAECAREMIVTKDYLRSQIDFMPFWEKPPLFIWLEVLSMKLFGVGEYAARFPDAVTGIVTLVTIYYIGKRIANEKVARWWVLLYVASWLPHFYFKSGIIDPVFNLFIFLAFFQVHLLRFSEKKNLHALLAGLFIGLAVLTKGPVAVLVSVLALGIYLILNRSLTGYKVKHLLLIAVAATIPFFLWMGAAVAAHGVEYGKWFMTEFVSYQARLFTTEDADHGGPVYYHVIVLLFGCFPASVFLFQFTRKKTTDNLHAHDFTRWMWILFGVVLFLFSIVKTKIVHYSSLCYFPITYLAALQLCRLELKQVKLKKTVTVLLLFTGTVVALLITALPLVGIYKQQLIPYINDPFAVGNLSADVPWNYAECLFGAAYLIGIWVCAFLMRKRFTTGFVALGIIQVLIIQVSVIHFTPKIEAYSQNAAIGFFKSFSGKDVYVHPLDYKSYANLFYTRKTPNRDSSYNSYHTDHEGRKLEPTPNGMWLLEGHIDRPAYFICKIQNKQHYTSLPQLTLIGDKNGFVFFERNNLYTATDTLTH